MRESYGTEENSVGARDLAHGLVGERNAGAGVERGAGLEPVEPKVEAIEIGHELAGAPQAGAHHFRTDAVTR